MAKNVIAWHQESATRSFDEKGCESRVQQPQQSMRRRKTADVVDVARVLMQLGLPTTPVIDAQASGRDSRVLSLCGPNFRAPRRCTSS